MFGRLRRFRPPACWRWEKQLTESTQTSVEALREYYKRHDHEDAVWDRLEAAEESSRPNEQRIEALNKEWDDARLASGVAWKRHADAEKRIKQARAMLKRCRRR